MKEAGFVGCCTANIIYDLGGTELTMGRREAPTEDRLKRYLEVRILERAGRKCIVVMTNSQQNVANKVLLELGFKHSKWMSKRQHPETKVRLWWKEP